MIDTTEHAILVAHDDVHTRCELAFALRAAGFQTVQVGTGLKALTYAEYVSAALIHIHLPDVDGEEVCRILRSKPRTARLPIIQLSALPADGVGVGGALNFADACVLTPVADNVLTGAVAELLAKKNRRGRAP